EGIEFLEQATRAPAHDSDRHAGVKHAGEHQSRLRLRTGGWMRSVMKSSLAKGPRSKKSSHLCPLGTMRRPLPTTKISTARTPSGKATCGMPAYIRSVYTGPNHGQLDPLPQQQDPSRAPAQAGGMLASAPSRAAARPPGAEGGLQRCPGSPPLR